MLCKPPVHPDLVPGCNDARVRKSQYVAPLHGGDWWAHATRKMAFNRPDANDAGEFNRILWEGMVGENVPYPAGRSQADLSQNRDRVLASYQLPVPVR